MTSNSYFDALKYRKQQKHSLRALEFSQLFEQIKAIFGVEGIEITLDSSALKPFLQYDSSDDGTYYVTVKLPRKNAETRKAARSRLFDLIPIFTSETFSSAPDGVYTWIMSDKGFYTSTVLSIFEHGTIHKQLAGRVDARKIFNAGECMKKGNNIVFNLLSGTYTRHMINEEIATDAELETSAQSMFESMGFTVSKGPKKVTMITSLPTYSELKLYADAGYDVMLYRDQESCKQLRRTILANRLATVESSMKKPLFASVLPKLTAEKASLEREIARLNANIPVRLSGGGRSRRQRRRRRTMKK